MFRLCRGTVRDNRKLRAFPLQELLASVPRSKTALESPCTYTPPPPLTPAVLFLRGRKNGTGKRPSCPSRSSSNTNSSTGGL